MLARAHAGVSWVSHCSLPVRSAGPGRAVQEQDTASPSVKPGVFPLFPSRLERRFEVQGTRTALRQAQQQQPMPRGLLISRHWCLMLTQSNSSAQGTGWNPHGTEGLGREAMGDSTGVPKTHEKALQHPSRPLHLSPTALAKGEGGWGDNKTPAPPAGLRLASPRWQ